MSWAETKKINGDMSESLDEKLKRIEEAVCTYSCVASDNVLAVVRDTEKRSSLTDEIFNYVRIKNCKGTLKVNITFKTGQVAYTAYGQIYRNGILYASIETDSDEYTTLSTTIEVSPLDLIEFKFSPYSGRSVYVNNITVCGDITDKIEVSPKLFYG